MSEGTAGAFIVVRLVVGCSARGDDIRVRQESYIIVLISSFQTKTRSIGKDSMRVLEIIVRLLL